MECGYLKSHELIHAVSEQISKDPLNFWSIWKHPVGMKTRDSSWNNSHKTSEMSYEFDSTGGLIEYGKSKDSVVLTLWTKNPSLWMLYPFDKIVVTTDISATCTIKSDRGNLPNNLDSEYKSAQKNALKFTSASWQYCEEEKEKQVSPFRCVENSMVICITNFPFVLCH